MKHKKFLTFIPVLGMLFSCNQKSIAGVYYFQMGKDQGTHFGVYVTLSNKKWESEKHPVADAKMLYFDLNIGGDKKSSGSFLEELAKILADLRGDKKYILSGYYYRDRTLRDGEQEVKIGIDLDDLFNSFQTIDVDDPEDPAEPEALVLRLGDEEETPSEDPSEDEPTIPDTEEYEDLLLPEDIEKVLFTTYQSDTLKLYIPVSFNDLLFQFYWYGVDYRVDDYGLPERFENKWWPEEQANLHLAGTHPTAADVTYINETLNYGETHSDIQEKFKSYASALEILTGGKLNIDIDLSEYRDYNTLPMGLVKK